MEFNLIDMAQFDLRGQKEAGFRSDPLDPRGLVRDTPITVHADRTFRRVSASSWILLRRCWDCPPELLFCIPTPHDSTL